VKTRQTRRAEVRAATLPDGRPGVVLKAITPYIVDDYGSVFMPDTFDESLRARGPVLCWSHDWDEPLGPYVGHEAGEDGAPNVSFAFSDFDAVPAARRAHAQVSDGTILDCSVGFSMTERREPTTDELVKYPGVREVITKATLDEISLVIRGAVPGAKVLAYRSGKRSKVDIDAVVELGRRVSTGELTDAEAQAALNLLAGEDTEPPAPPPSDEEPPPAPEVDAQLTADVDAALSMALGRSAHRA